MKKSSRSNRVSIHLAHRCLFAAGWRRRSAGRAGRDPTGIKGQNQVEIAPNLVTTVGKNLALDTPGRFDLHDDDRSVPRPDLVPSATRRSPLATR